jgi:hypothetical protein
MIILVILPIILDKNTAGLLLAAYVGGLVLIELILILISKSVASISLFNFYLYVQFLCGALRKAAFLGCALFSGICIRAGTEIGLIVGIIGLTLILIE